MKVHYTPKYLLDATHRITVTVVGVGGNGTQALHDLAKMHMTLLGLGHPGLLVTAIDDDVIETPNIGRQKFSEADLGENKASTIITRLNRFYGLDWMSETERFTEKNWRGTNFIISCVDTVNAREEIAKGFKKYAQSGQYTKAFYWLDFGNQKDFGQFVLGSNVIEQPKSKKKTVKKLKNVFDLFPEMSKNEDITAPSCSTREALLKQDLFINSVLVSTGMNLLWQLLTKYMITTHGGYVNLRTYSTRPIKL